MSTDAKKGVTISFGNVCENSYTMEEVELNVTPPKAYVLVFRGVFSNIEKKITKSLTWDEEVVKDDEILAVEWDKEEYSKYTNGPVNSRARYKLCFAPSMKKLKRPSDIPNRKGTVYSIDNFPLLKNMHDVMSEMVEYMYGKEIQLFVEGNYYYNLDKTYIEFHRDKERALTIACRFGDSFPALFAWYVGSQRISKVFNLELNSGDIYLMSEYATGNRIGEAGLAVKHAAGKVDKLFK